MKAATKVKSNWWFLLPIFLNISGGAIAYFVLRNEDPEKAKNCLMLGAVLLAILIFLGVLLTWLGPAEQESEPDYDPSALSPKNCTTSYDECFPTSDDPVIASAPQAPPPATDTMSATTSDDPVITSAAQIATIEPMPSSGIPGCQDADEGCYNYPVLTVRPRTTITFMNTDNVAHTLIGGTATDGPSGAFDSGLVLAGASYKFTLDQKGTYDHYCLVHPWMTGQIIVEGDPLTEEELAELAELRSASFATVPPVSLTEEEMAELEWLECYESPVLSDKCRVEIREDMREEAERSPRYAQFVLALEKVATETESDLHKLLEQGNVCVINQCTKEQAGLVIRALHSTYFKIGEHCFELAEKILGHDNVLDECNLFSTSIFGDEYQEISDAMDRIYGPNYWVRSYQVEEERPVEQGHDPAERDLKRAYNEYWLCVAQGELEGMLFSEHFCQINWYENTKHLDHAPNPPWR